MQTARIAKWDSLADQVLKGEPIARDDAYRIATAPDDELLAILHAAFRLRSRYHDRRVRLHVLQNAKSGVCPEDCKFCSQSLKHNTDVRRYGMQSVDQLLDGARRAWEKGAVTFCIVTATRGPSNVEIDTVCAAARAIKQRYPLRICVSLGILKPGQAEKLYEGGVDRYNHNLETSQRHYPKIVTTHTWADRVKTVKMAKAAGLEACSGGIIGMGEAAEDWVDLAYSLKEIGVESVPINFLDPRPGTPLAGCPKLRPQTCLKVLAMFRFVHPAVDLRVAGGREAVLDKLQPLALYVANSLFTDGYLTTRGQGESEDLRLIAQAAFELESADAQPLPKLR